MSKFLAPSSLQLKNGNGMELDQSVRSVTCLYTPDSTLCSPEPVQTLEMTLVVTGDFLVERSGELAFVMKLKRKSCKDKLLCAFSCVLLSIDSLN